MCPASTLRCWPTVGWVTATARAAHTNDTGWSDQSLAWFGLPTAASRFCSLGRPARAGPTTQPHLVPSLEKPTSRPPHHSSSWAYDKLRPRGPSGKVQVLHDAVGGKCDSTGSIEPSSPFAGEIDRLRSSSTPVNGSSVPSPSAGMWRLCECCCVCVRG